MNEYTRKVLWAVNPAAEDKAFQLQVARSVEKLVSGLPVRIEPVAVLPPQDPATVEWNTQLTEWTETLNMPALLPPVFLAQAAYTLESSVQALVEYAALSNAEMIAVGTHSKKPLERFFLGSFAETLVASSPQPVFIVSPESQELQTDRILFPTDFTELSYAAFQSLLTMAKEKKSQVILFHKVQFEAPPPVFGFDPVPVYDQFLAQDNDRKRTIADRWKKEAQNRGVQAEVIFHDTPGFPVDAILSSARQQGCGMIALASESSPTEAALLGSISHQVMRHAFCPVWVLHPHARHAS